MARATYRCCKYCGEWHDIYNWPDNHRDPEPERSPLAAPSVIGDTIEPLQSMANGQMYTSKAALRASYLPSGNPEGVRYTEVGGDPAILRERKPPPIDKAGIKAAVGRAFSQAGLGA